MLKEVVITMKVVEDEHKQQDFHYTSSQTGKTTAIVFAVFFGFMESGNLECYLMIKNGNLHVHLIIIQRWSSFVNHQSFCILKFYL